MQELVVAEQFEEQEEPQEGERKRRSGKRPAPARPMADVRMMAGMARDFLTPEQAAFLVGVSEQHIRQAARRGSLPSHQVTGRSGRTYDIEIALADLMEYYSVEL